MAGFPSVNFGSAERGLFTPEEIGRLMESEYQRSTRYGYPLSVLLIEIDRLESLHDLYGVESEQRIVRAVTDLLRSSTRASDVMGRARDQRLMVLLPHTPRAGAVAIARRLLVSCRELEFRGDGRSLRASLSIGIATRADEGGLSVLTENAVAALEAAVAAGGDRLTEHAEHAELAGRQRGASEVGPAVPARARRPAAPAPAPLPSVQELAGGTLEEKVRRLLELAGSESDLTQLEREVLFVLKSALGEGRRSEASHAEVQAQIRALEARVAELKRMLSASEEELARMIEEKSADPGVASIYRTVQGLDPSAQGFAQRRELLALIYRANVELLRQLEGEAGKG